MVLAICGGLRSFQPSRKFIQRQLALQAMALLAIADFFVERWEQVESDIRRLEIFGVGVSYVMRERSKR